MNKLFGVGVLVLASVFIGCAAEDEPGNEPEQPGSTTPADPAPAPAATQQAAAAKPDCSVPYTVGQDGRKHYRIECLQP